MAEKISDLSGAEREKRIAELKQKMHQAAKRAQAEHQEDAAPPPPPTPEPQPAAIEAPALEAPAVEAPAARATAVEAVAVAEDKAPPPPKVAPARAPKEAAPAGNGASAPKPAAERKPPPAAEPKVEPQPEGLSSVEMNRREFLTYAWGGALALLGLQAGVGAFLFMYPRFKAGEFGGKFFLGSETALPDPSAAPLPDTTGKFWLVNTEDAGPKALYMVCTHLGCLFKWEASNNRFECPCHGSKFTREGDYIEGPAPRSLDHFDIAIEDGQVVVDTGSRILGAPASESPARVEPV